MLPQDLAHRGDGGTTTPSSAWARAVWSGAKRHGCGLHP
jgi:hypothetical protein